MLPANSTASEYVQGHPLGTVKKLALRMCNILSSFLSEWIEMIPPESITLNILYSFCFIS